MNEETFMQKNTHEDELWKSLIMWFWRRLDIQNQKISYEALEKTE